MEQKRVKIIYCITKGVWGGAQRYVYDLATSLPRDLYDVTVILGGDGVLSRKLEDSQIKSIYLKNLTRDIKIWRDFLTLLKLIKIFRREKPDIIHLNSSKMGLLGTIAGRIARVPKIIFTVHGWAFNEDRSATQKKIIRLLHSLTIKLTNITIAVSEETKRQMPGPKIVVIQNGINEMSFLDRDVARKELLNKLPTEVEISKTKWIGTISELHKNKGLKYIIEALHILETKTENPDSLPMLIIIGEGERREKLQERIKRYNLQDNVFLVGQIENAARYLKAFDIFTLTSITEALPYVILEAGQAGLPIIASAVGGIPEIIDNANSGLLVPPKEPEEIEKALVFLLNNPEKARILGEKIQSKVKQDFNKDKMVKKTISLYN